MTFNQQMHPRNRYKDRPPDFKALALLYPEFRKHCKIDINGKLTFDFKNPEGVRMLTWALLKHDFSLDIQLPPDCLVPRVPQRLNYILWLEDLLELTKDKTICDARRIRGIDIGTGASCVYPLLGVRQCNWSFLATDKDPTSVQTAQHNVTLNGLCDSIRVVLVPENTALQPAVDLYDNLNAGYDFCMCNPPFYDSNGESTTFRPDRPDPHSATVARLGEIAAEGGEVGFVSRIIEDSIALQQRIKIYTSMVGKKSSLTPLKAKLQAAGVCSQTMTTFCQGRTQRWALAWTFTPNVVLQVPAAGDQDAAITAAVSKAAKVISLELGISQILPSYNTGSVNGALNEAINKRVLDMLDELKIVHNMEDHLDSERHVAAAYTNTWSHQRRKRRAMQREATSDLSCSKQPRFDNQNGNPSSNHDNTPNNDVDIVGQDSLHNSRSSIVNCSKSSVTCEPPLVKFGLRVHVPGEQEQGRVVLSFDWLSGCRDSLNQIVQYFKNVFAVR